MVAFTQFLLPYGRRRANSIDMPADVEALATELRYAGYRFECEILRTGEVYFDCCGPAPDGSGGDMPIANGVCPNGREVVATVEDVVRSAHAAWKDDRAERLRQVVPQ